VTAQQTCSTCQAHKEGSSIYTGGNCLQQLIPYSLSESQSLLAYRPTGGCSDRSVEHSREIKYSARTLAWPALRGQKSLPRYCVHCADIPLHAKADDTVLGCPDRAPLRKIPPYAGSYSGCWCCLCLLTHLQWQMLILGGQSVHQDATAADVAEQGLDETVIATIMKLVLLGAGVCA